MWFKTELSFTFEAENIDDAREKNVLGFLYVIKDQLDQLFPTDRKPDEGWSFDEINLTTNPIPEDTSEFDLRTKELRDQGLEPDGEIK